MRFYHYIFIIAALCSLASCRSTGLYTSGITESSENLPRIDTNYQHIIDFDDKISISIWNHNDMSVGSLFSIYNSNEAFGKWLVVDPNGMVDVPKLGRVKISGMDCITAAEKLRVALTEWLVDPIVVVRVMNREVMVLGEVRTPGAYVLDKERNSISEIIARAQGVERYADIEKVQLIREGKNYLIDLTVFDENQNGQILVMSGDVINIPSKKGKQLDQKAPTIIPFASALTAIAVLFSIFSK